MQKALASNHESTTLAKDLKITQKSAWFVLHRIRHAARTNSFMHRLRETLRLIQPSLVASQKTSKR
jgi:hypothetical protein